MNVPMRRVSRNKYPLFSLRWSDQKIEEMAQELKRLNVNVSALLKPEIEPIARKLFARALQEKKGVA